MNRIRRATAWAAAVLLLLAACAGAQAEITAEKKTERGRVTEITWKDENGNDLPKTVISREYSSEWKPGDEPYYPVNDAKNTELYSRYAEMAAKEEKVIFGGRLASYRYYDMDQVIAEALENVRKF